MLHRFILLLFIAGFGMAVVAQEIAYVTDSLQLGLHEAQDTSDQAFENLPSGTRLEVLERASSYARVRTPGGQEGWVRTAFLVSEVPARFRVAEMDAELEGLRTDLARARAARIGAEEETARLRRQVAGHAESLGSMQATLSRLRTENAAYEERLERYRRSVPLHLALGGLVAAAVAGFAGGLWWLDARIRRRHGGFRIY